MNAILCIVLSFPAVIAAQGADEEVLRTLFAQDNRIGVASFLKQRYPDFHKAAVGAGLVEYLDGEVDLATVRARTKGKGKLSTTFELIQRAVGGSTGKLEVKDPSYKVADVYAAGAMDDPVKMAEILRGRLYSAQSHPLARLLRSKLWSQISIAPGEGKLVWFNPYVSIPELGIRSGEPMTEAQQEALMQLFAVKTTKDAKEAIGTTFHPADVGRAINPNPGVLTILTDSGAVIPDLVSKGTGPNANTKRDGLLSLAEALMDAEVSRNLMKTGAVTYTPLAVIETKNGKAVYVRAAGSLLRQFHLNKVAGSEFSALVDVIAGAVSHGGASTGPRLRGWFSNVLPSLMGYNAGLLSGLGIKHGSLLSDNVGLRGELVDWGMAEFGHRGGEVQKKGHWEIVKGTLDRVNEMLPAIVLESADRAAFDELVRENGIPITPGDGETELRTRIMKRMKGSPLKLEGVSDLALLQRIVVANGGKAAKRDGATALHRKVVEQIRKLVPGQSTIGGLNRAELETLARAQGLEVGATDTDVQIAERVINEVKTWQRGGIRGLTVNLETAQRKFNEEFARGKTVGAKENATLIERFLSQADEATLWNLAKGFGGRLGEVKKLELLDLLKRNGVIVAAGDAKELPPTKAGANDRGRSLVAEEAIGAGRFAAAYLLKEAFKALETGDGTAMKRAVADLGTGRFWVDLGVFSVAARGAEHLVIRVGAGSVLKAAIPLAVGMTAVQLLHGHVSARDVLIDTTAFLIAGFVVHHAMDGLVYPLLFATPPGMIRVALYSVVKLALTLYGGEKLGGWLRAKADREEEAWQHRGGILEKVNRLVAQE